MLILILCLSTLILIPGVIFKYIGRTEYKKSRHAEKGFKHFCYNLYYSDVATNWVRISSVVLIIALVLTGCVGASYSKHTIIDEKIALYEAQNAKIEAQVATAVEGYKEFEADTFANCKPEDLTLVLTLYPELSSNELVKQQICLYQSNNEKILSLKEQKLNLEVCRWWLFFG